MLLHFRYSLARYLRCRLRKIEESLEAILENIDLLDRLSPQEKRYATKLNTLKNNHFEDVVYAQLDETLKEFLRDAKDRRLHAQPQLQEFVFCRSLIDEGSVYGGDLHLFDLRKGNTTCFDMLCYFMICYAMICYLMLRT